VYLVAKKPSKKREGAVTKFSIKGLSNAIDSVITRLKEVPASPAKAALLLKIKAIQLIAHCGPDMSFDL
jgi:hypothetical protein